MDVKVHRGVETLSTAQQSGRTIEVLGKFEKTAKGDIVTLEEVVAAAQDAKYPNIAIYDRDSYLKDPATAKRLSQSDFPYSGNVMVTDVNIAG